MSMAVCRALTYTTLLVTSIATSASHWATQSLQQLQSEQPLRSLPSNANATLGVVALGVGIQNYTCAGPSGEPESAGAIATLFDATEILRQKEPATWPDLMLRYFTAYSGLPCQASINLDRSECEERANGQYLKVIGKHWFGGDTVQNAPLFYVAGRAVLSARKVGVAPPDRKTDVDWLFLTTDEPHRPGKLVEVYRILTTGGRPQRSACKKAGDVLSVKYVATYWFYACRERNSVCEGKDLASEAGTVLS